MIQEKTVLIVEDEPDIQELIRYHLEKEGYATMLCASGSEALNIIEKQHPDLVLLDLMLPEISGIEVLKKVRFMWNLKELPIIIVSARTDETDVITGLELGADNYLPKPFSPKVLVANVKALLRRASTSSSTKNTHDDNLTLVGDLKIDQTRHEAFYEGSALVLTASEFSLLTLLASSPGRVFTRNQIISGMRGDDYPVTERSIDVQIASVRKKMGSGGNLIKTVWGIGYSYQDKP
ncbi:MAG: response regulator transcription factor [Sphaerochaeta sp.]|nr:response regulator transcription factor [Sphaerochaeta sp.]